MTQIVLGASVGEAVLGKKMGNTAILWGGLAGTLPDLDVFIRLFTNEITATYLHRGFSHSLAFCVIAAPLLGWLAHKIHSKREATRKNWSWMFFWCLVTHPLLDVQTTYGTQFLWPLENRLAFKNVFVVDPLYTVPFLILLVITMFYKRTSPTRRKWNKWALIISNSYLFLTLIFKSVGYFKFKDSLEQNGVTSYVRMDTQPTPLNSILWNAQVETETGYIAGYYSLFDSKEVSFLREIPKNHQLLDPYSNQKAVQQLLKISSGWYSVEKEGDGFVFTDIRFGQFGFDDEAPYVWKWKLEKNPDGKIEVNRHNPPSGNQDFSKALEELKKRIKGN
ncbi:MAG: metal-dependent hydrolase [Aurantibacter sp.]